MDTFFILFYCALFQIHSIFYNEYIKRTIFYKNIRKKDEKIKNLYDWDKHIIHDHFKKSTILVTK